MIYTIGRIAIDLNKEYVWLEADGSDLIPLVKYYKEVLGFRELVNKYMSIDWGGWLHPLYIPAKDLDKKFK